ncbi:hypothetical protein IG631_21886 [Alternaria alternata]|nr:hypothetical protein IG631_21886 [Alternaria alternata]
MRPTTRSTSSGLNRRPVVTIWRPMSSATAVVPSRARRIEALSWALARSTSAEVTFMERRDHSRRVKWTRSSSWVRLELVSVRVAGGEAHEAVGQSVLRDEVAELAAKVVRGTHGAVPVTNDSLCDEGSEVVGVAPANTLNGNGDVGSAHGVVTEADLGTNEVGLRLLLGSGGLGRVVLGLRGEVGEVLLGEVDELLVGNTTSANEDHAVGSVVGLDVVLEIGALDALDVLLGSEDGAAEGLALEGSGVQVVKDDLLELLVDLLLLAEDDITLALDGLGLELGVLEDIGEDVDGGGDVVVEGLGVVDGVLALVGLIWGSLMICVYDVPRCRRSGARPCFLSRVPTAAGCASEFPVPSISPASLPFVPAIAIDVVP